MTVLIAAYDEQGVIATKLEETLGLDYPRDSLQVVVATDGSRDSTPAIVQGYAHRNVILSHSDIRAGKTAAIARAMRTIQTELVVFSDANNHYEADLLRAIVGPFADPSVGAVSGAKMVGGGAALGASEGLYWRYEGFIKSKESDLGCCTSTSGEIFAIRRALWEDPPAGIINDDFYIAARIISRGWRVAYEPRAHSFENVTDSAESERIRRTRIIAGRYQAMKMARQLLPRKRPLVAWQMVSHKFLRPLVPFAMVVAAAANIAALRRNQPGLAPRTGRASTWVILIIQAGFYAAAIGGHRISRPRWARTGMYLPRFLVDSNIAALIGFVRFIRGRQSAAWEKPTRSSESLNSAKAEDPLVV